MRSEQPTARKPFKVFNIGFHKTCTTSIGKALRQLGYNVTGPNWVHHPDLQNQIEALILETVPQYDAFQDNPWPLMYRFLDKQFPESKFILSVRSTDAWLRSCVKHFKSRNTAMREWIYGVGHPKGNEQVYIDRYEQHNREVRQYFSGRPDALLVMDVEAGDGWQKLCSFLHEDVPRHAFPHRNKANKVRQLYLPISNGSQRLFAKFRDAIGAE